jgi:hypothetical protein
MYDVPYQCASCVSPDPNSSGFRGLGAKAAFEAEAIGL